MKLRTGMPMGLAGITTNLHFKNKLCKTHKIELKHKVYSGKSPHVWL